MASFFKISPAVIKDDFKRFWVIPVLAFLNYFLFNIFYIIMNLKYIVDDPREQSYIANSIQAFLSGSNGVSLCIMVWVSVLSVLLVFRYLHNSGHVVAVHSQPFTRQTLLNSHTLTCVLFISIPIVLTGLIMLIIARPTFILEYDGDTAVKVDVFTRLNVLRWMFESLLTSLFIMVVSIVGGLITGTVFHHAVAAIGFNMVFPICTGVLMLYGETYLFGYCVPEWHENLIYHMSPVLNVAQGGYLSLAENLLYVALVVLLYAFASFLYRKRKLERATEGIVFDCFTVIVTFIFGYLGMTTLGLVFYGLFDNSNAAAIFGYIVGGLIGMLVIRMIILKTVKVFNRKTLILLGAYTLAALVFFAVIIFDLFGYEGRITDKGDAASLDCDILNGQYTEQENIDLVKEVHQFIIDNKEYIIANSKADENYEDVTWLNLSYLDGFETETADDDKVVERRTYSVPTYMLHANEAFRKLIESEETKQVLLDQIPERSELSYIQVYSGKYFSTSAYGTNDSEFVIMNDSAEMSGLIDAIRKDISERTAEDVIRAYNAYDIVEVDFHYTPKNSGQNTLVVTEMETDDPDLYLLREDVSSEMSYDSMYYNDYDTDAIFELYLNSSYKNAIAWLRDNGFADLVTYDPTYISYAVVYDVVYDVENGETEEGIYDGKSSETAIPESGNGYTVISDADAIQKMYENCVSHTCFGALSEINSSEDGIYKVEFYKVSDNTAYYEYSAFVEKQYINAA